MRSLKRHVRCCDLILHVLITHCRSRSKHRIPFQTPLQNKLILLSFLILGAVNDIFNIVILVVCLWVEYTYLVSPRHAHWTRGFHKRAAMLSVCSLFCDVVQCEGTVFHLFIDRSSPCFLRLTTSPTIQCPG